VENDQILDSSPEVSAVFEGLIGARRVGLELRKEPHIGFVTIILLYLNGCNENGERSECLSNDNERRTRSGEPGEVTKV
jgi:hypothetical protein